MVSPIVKRTSDSETCPMSTLKDLHEIAKESARIITFEMHSWNVLFHHDASKHIDGKNREGAKYDDVNAPMSQ